MSKKVGTLIKEARTNAGMTQAQLAKKVKGLTAADIGKAERGEKALTQDQLKQIAKATGVTQKSLLDAAKGTYGKTSNASGKTSGKTSNTSGKTSNSVTLSAEEKKLITLFRKADADTKKKVLETLGDKSETGSVLENILGEIFEALIKQD